MQYVLKWQKGTPNLYGFDVAIPVSCVVRNELNGWRKYDQVVYTIPGGRPYMPRDFPEGRYIVGRPFERKDPYRAPYFIPTNAVREVPVWKVLAGKYLEPTGEYEIDRDYGLHYSSSGTTLGCIKIETLDDAVFLGEQIMHVLDEGHEVALEVTHREGT